MKMKINPTTGRLDMVGSGESKADGVTYTNLTPTPKEHGGLAKGSTFDEKPVSEILDAILYPYVAPSISLASTVTAGVKENGTTISPTLTATVTQGSAEVVKIELLRDGKVIETQEGNRLKAQWTVRDISTKTSFAARVTDKTGGRATSKTVDYVFYNPIYYGLTTATMVTEVNTLRKVLPTGTSGTVTLDYGTFDKQRMVFAVCGTLSKMLNPSAFDVTQSFKERTHQLPVQNPLTKEDRIYSVYISNENSQGKAYTCKGSYNLK